MAPLRDIKELEYSRKVLVVDDDRELLEIIKDIIGERFDLSTAENAQEGLELLKQKGPFALVLSDLHMPGMDGIAFLNQVREISPRTVRIIITAFADMEAALNAINASHIYRFLTKPLRAQDILDAAEDGVKQHRLLVDDEVNLEEREKRLRAALMQLPLPAMIHAEDGEAVLINEAWTSLTGYNRKDMPTVEAWTRLCCGDQWWDMVQQVAALHQLEGSASQGEFEFTNKSGEKLVWDFNSAPLGKLHDGRSVVITIAADVTERRRMADSLALSGLVFQNSTNGILVTDGEGNILDVNPAMCEMSGYERQELLGQNPRVFKSGRHTSEYYCDMWDALKKKGNWRGEIYNRRKNGEIYPAWLTITAVVEKQAGAHHFVAISSDLSALMEAQERMEYLARHDHLTGLPNRQALKSCLEQAMGSADQKGRKVLVVYLDLDQFKLVNESLGHDRGDEALLAVAKRLQNSLAESDSLVRWGGDHFVGVMNLNGDVDKAEDMASRLLACFQAPFDIGGQQLYMSASLGMSLYPDDSRDPDVLVQHADTAMHAAKELGRRRYKFFSAQMNRRVVERLALESDLRSALDNKEFFLVYQPRVDVATGAVEGVEALIRWQHPTLGLLMPDHFLSAAEDSGLIVPIGQQVLEMACSQVKQWLAEGVPVKRVAVNLSGRQFWEEDLAGMITGTLSHYGLTTKHFELEVTESVVMGSVTAAARVLRELHDLGIEIALDDFGTGYSSLYYLKELPIDTLKIDKSFINNIPDERESTTIVSIVASLAHGLGMGVIVEGVETRRQLETVAGFGCEQVQGYYFSRPIHPEEISALLSQNPFPFADKIPEKSPKES
ncbi:MAG: EAL domain-containing protein [Deltaproteobacteria bacterium]|nr:EAL domain-containing protein [Deltaproteobacteria bacterium]